MEKPRVIEIDDILRGYNDFNKLTNIYLQLRERVFTSEPMQLSRDPLINLKSPNWRGGSYGWELHQTGIGLCMLEYFCRSDGYSDANQLPKRPGVSSLVELRITIHNDDGSLRKTIDDVVSQFPREAPKNGEVLAA